MGADACFVFVNPARSDTLQHSLFFFFNDTATTEIYPFPLHDALPISSPEPAPLAEAIRNADLAALWLAIEALPLPQRNALLLREFGGLSYDELAAALAVSTPAVDRKSVV